MSSFFDWIDERAEPMLPDELSARNIAIIEDIVVEDENIELDNTLNEFKTAVGNRVEINKQFKRKITKIEKDLLLVEKEKAVKLVDKYRLEKDEREKKLIDLKRLKKVAKNRETKI